MEVIKKNYNALDICKFLLAVFLVCAHTATRIQMPTILDMFTSFYIIVVPFFFLTSGFLFFKKINECKDIEARKDRYVLYTKRILKMYLVWSIIYCTFNIGLWVKEGVVLDDVIRYFYQFFTYSSYPTIWFLPALWIAVTLVYFLQKITSTNNIILIGTLTYILGWIGYSLSDIIEFITPLSDLFEKVFTSYRNGLMYGVIYVALGLKIAEKNTDEKILKNAVLALSFSVIFIIEAFITNKYLRIDCNYLITIIPFSYYFVQTLLNIHLSDKYSQVYLFCRNMSLLVFLSQRIFISAIPALYPEIAAGIYSNWIIGLLIILLFTLVFSISVIQLSPKFKILNYLWH